jgi:phage terminase large subunit-like protein
MRDFPNGKFDDQIDALSRAFAEMLGPNRTGNVTELRL